MEQNFSNGPEPIENANPRPEVTQYSEDFDANGAPRKRRVFESGVVAYLSEDEYAEELEKQKEN